MNNATLCVLLAALSATALTAQEPTDRNEKRAASAKLELVWQWQWGEGDLPALPPFGRGPVLGPLAFSVDGSVLAFELGNLSSSTFPAVLAMTLPGGKPKELATGDVALVGPAGEGGFLLRIDTELWRLSADGESEEMGDLEVPNRSDSWISPFAPRLLECGMVRYVVSTNLMDLKAGKTVRLPVGDTHPTAVAWHPDDKLVAFGMALFGSGGAEVGEGIVVFSTAGRERQRWSDREQPVRALDFSVDGRSLTWVDDRIRRADIESGEELATAEGRPEFWANVDPVLAISHDGNRVQLWDGVELRRARGIELGEKRPELPKAVRLRARGVVLRTAISAKRDLLALATFEGLRVYRIVP